MNWLIKLLGGYTAEEYDQALEWLGEAEVRNDRLQDIYEKQLDHIQTLQTQLREAQKNDHRDDKGRYTKGTDE